MIPKEVFNFKKDATTQDWKIVDDVVMGGKSEGSFALNSEGQGVFRGSISLKNNGGFSSVRHSFESITTDGFSKIVLRVHGDGKQYQFSIKASAKDAYSYIIPFKTTGGWEDIIIELAEMYPSFRGRKLDKPNFSAKPFEEIGILFGNKKEEEFRLVIEKVELR